MCFLKKGSLYDFLGAPAVAASWEAPPRVVRVGAHHCTSRCPSHYKFWFFLQVFLLEENYYGRVVLAGSVTETDAPGCNHPFLSDHHLVI